MKFSVHLLLILGQPKCWSFEKEFPGIDRIKTHFEKNSAIFWGTRPNGRPCGSTPTVNLRRWKRSPRRFTTGICSWCHFEVKISAVCLQNSSHIVYINFLGNGYQPLKECYGELAVVTYFYVKLRLKILWKVCLHFLQLFVYNLLIDNIFRS